MPMTTVTMEVTDLVYKDFANQESVVAKEDVDKVWDAGDRVWITVGHQIIEVKNIEVVIDWGRTSGKLHNWNEE